MHSFIAQFHRQSVAFNFVWCYDQLCHVHYVAIWHWRYSHTGVLSAYHMPKEVY